MDHFKNLVITDIKNPQIVHSEKGREFQMVNRPACGLSLCCSGQITYTMNQKEYVSNPGTAVFLPQGGTYTLTGDKDGFFPVISFTCTNFPCDEIVVLPLANPEACIQSFRTLQELFLHNRSKLTIFSTFYDLLDKVFRFHAQQVNPLDLVIKYAEEHIQDPELNNTALAKEIGISEVYLRKLFLTHYHVTPKQYILDLRIRKAKLLLLDTPFTVTTIAEECGFSSVYHFCRFFKQRTGQTPTQFSAANRIYKI